MGNNQLEVAKPLSSYYPVVGDDHFSLKNYMKNRRLNAMEFQKVKAENQKFDSYRRLKFDQNKIK